MKTSRSLLKLIALITVFLLWAPYVVLVISSVIQSLQAQQIIIDYLIPAELFFLIAIGLFGLNIVALNLGYHIKEIAITTIVILVLMLNVVIVPQLTGITNTPFSPVDMAFIGVFVVLVLYIAFTLFAGLLSIYLAKHLWYVKKRTKTY